jgi:acid stress-induced BolA-like protein IbaG/YrbA
MNSVAIIEQEIEGTQLHYMVVVLSNILRKNSAVEHQALGVDIHNLMRVRYGLEEIKP